MEIIIDAALLFFIGLLAFPFLKSTFVDLVTANQRKRRIQELLPVTTLLTMEQKNFILHDLNDKHLNMYDFQNTVLSSEIKHRIENRKISQETADLINTYYHVHHSTQ